MHPIHQRPRLALAIALLATAPAFADPAAFDLAGPSLEVEVTHGTATLPIAQVPNLSAGDRVWLKTDFAAQYSVHYLMVAAFLRGSTDPPRTTGRRRAEGRRHLPTASRGSCDCCAADMSLRPPS